MLTCKYIIVNFSKLFGQTKKSLVQNRQFYLKILTKNNNEKKIPNLCSTELSAKPVCELTQ